MKLNYTILLIVTCFFGSSLAQTKYGDGSLRLESDVSLDWNSTQNSYTLKDSNVYEFDAMGKMIRRHKLIYDQTSKQWISDLIHIEQFDSRGNQITYTDSFTNPTKLGNRYKQITQYNNQDQETFTLQSKWNVTKSAWEPTFRETTTYNASGQVETDLGERFNPVKSDWFISLRRLYTTKSSGDNFYYKDIYDTAKKAWINEFYIYNSVDANMVQDTTLYQKYNTITKVWENYQKFTYRYDAQKRYLGNYAYNWVNNTWQPDRRNTYILLPDGQTKEYLFESWNSTQKALLNSSRQSYTYNGKGWLLSDSTELWNVTNSRWEMDTRRVQSYLTSGYLDQTISAKYNLTSSVWNNTTLTRYHYKSNPVSIKTKSINKQFNIYPNPAQNKFSIQSDVNAFEVCSVNIFDFTGKQVSPTLVRQTDASGEIEIDLSSYSLCNGTYFVEIHSTRGVGRMPLIVK
jgi:hypothetical protein